MNLNIRKFVFVSRATMPLLALSIIVPHAELVSQASKIEITGYQDFRWGMTRKTVEGMLDAKNEVIVESTEDNITVQAKLHLDSFPPTLEVKKSFFFLKNALGQITLTYQKTHLPFNTDSIFARLQRLLVLKYGESHSDTLFANDDVILRFFRWDFSKGFVAIRSVQFPESSRAHTYDLPELIFIHYGKKGIEEEIELEKKRRALDQF